MALQINHLYMKFSCYFCWTTKFLLSG